MSELSRNHPVYGFEHHKGYGTPEHWQALRRYGPCPEHRLTYRGVVIDREWREEEESVIAVPRRRGPGAGKREGGNGKRNTGEWLLAGPADR